MCLCHTHFFFSKSPPKLALCLNFAIVTFCICICMFILFDLSFRFSSISTFLRRLLPAHCHWQCPSGRPGRAENGAATRRHVSPGLFQTRLWERAISNRIRSQYRTNCHCATSQCSVYFAEAAATYLYLNNQTELPACLLQYHLHHILSVSDIVSIYMSKLITIKRHLKF